MQASINLAAVFKIIFYEDHTHGFYKKMKDLDQILLQAIKCSRPYKTVAVTNLNAIFPM